MYAVEHINDDGLYGVMLAKQHCDLLCVKRQSRHSNAKKYIMWIEFNDVDGDE